MIFYFSGTGNSKWVAEQVAETLKEEVKDIASLDSDEIFSFSEDQMVGVVFPVYAWRAPEPVAKFVKKIKANGAYTFAICTYGGNAGNTMEKISRDLPLDAGFGLAMPSNYLLMEMDSKEVIAEKLENAKKRVPEICESLQNREKKFDLVKGSTPGMKSGLFWWGFNTFARTTKPFTVNAEGCIGCGLCQMICPSRAISLKNGHPAWVKKQCYQCLGCINRCPVKVIEYGKSTKGRERYSFK